MKSLTAKLGLIATISVAVGAYWHETHGATKFKRSVWLQGETDSSNPRLRMADGLLKSGVLLDKSQADIEAMLGPPTSTNYFRDSGLVYWLGPERGFISIDSEWLTLNFDHAGRVSDASIVTD